ncbi:TPA: fibronectin binding protein [Streptococcus pyogenes]|nr:serum opacification factor [Streptococcus pyogenes]VHF55197.1 serum opacity factor Sof [Streptococcus pyogenes]VHG41413.1 serum opacity factor Sof [Streptococcus pyogenes]HEP6114991.1 fibronectin binding protein [Streptococcus pyogenes]HEQ2364951.1 fibronectin binding protein [Streptococcus pyogenes]HEQ8517787.1 fibronectin binding protein [Streptococcus pyogenes]
MTNCKYKLRKLSVGLVSVGTMLIAPTVLGQEVSASTTSTETSAASAGTTANGTAASGAGSEATVATATTPSATTGTGGAAGSGTSDASVASSEGSQGLESGQASTQPQAQTLEQSATTSPSSNSSSSDAKSTKSATLSTSSASSTSSSKDKAPKTASTKSSSATVASSSNGSNQGAGTEAEPQMMDVEKYTVDKENSELKVKDGKETNGSGVNKKLIRNRDGEQRDIFDIKREVKTNSDGTIDVTVTVTPKEIDKGADVMALLDVSKKMTEEDFKNAKDKIKKLVTTLTGENGGEHKARNSVRLMTFYREISSPIDISRKTDKELDELLDKLRQEAKNECDWGVDLQGAIHKAREVFNNENNNDKKKSGKRQHIVLFSQGESTFSYDIKNKKDNKLQKNRLTTVTTSNPLFSWFPIFDHTNRKADMLDDFDKLLSIAQKFGIKIPEGVKAGLKTAATANSFIGTLTGGDGLTDYLTLREYMADKLQETDFDYSNRVGEGYHYHSFSERNISDMPMRSVLETLLDQHLPKLSDTDWFGWVLGKLSLTDKYRNGQKIALMKILDYLFYKREYVYYNHNLSAIAEAKMAQKEGITFYSVDVTSPNQAANKRTRRSADTPEEKRNEKFDKYLKDMSEGKTFLEDKDVTNKDKFKDTLTELKIKDEFTENVTVQESSKYKTSLTNGAPSVSYTAANKSFWGNTKESLTWTISKEQLKEAFEEGKSLTLTYKLKVDNDKFKTALDSKKKRVKRDTPTENENSVTEKIISNTITYKINDQNGQTDKKLDDVSLTYSKFKVPVPQIDGQVIEPQAPTLPKLPPVIEHGPNFEYEEETGYQLPLKHGSNAPDTQVTIEEDTVPQRPDILVGGQSGPVDITEDTQPGMSGSNDATVVEEDTTPKRPDVLVGGQSDPIDITEDTQPSVSGSNDATVVEEDTVPKRPDILVGGQSDPIDITEDTQPGMSGSNDATVIEEDTKPKRFFHFDNEPQAPEKPKEQPSLSLPQAPVYKAAHHLPASGDKREASFTIVALTIIGAAGLLSKKRRDTEEN